MGQRAGSAVGATCFAPPFASPSTTRPALRHGRIGGDDGVAYSPCEDVTPTFGDFGDAIWCEAAIDGSVDGARAGWYPWGDDPCTTNAQCQLGSVCAVAGYGCICESSWTDWESGDVEWDEDGATWCLLDRSAPPPCSAGIGGKVGCSETIDGDAIGNSGWAQRVGEYAGWGSRCTSSAECAALDSRCTSDANIHCVCELGWGWADPVGSSTYDNAYCAMFYDDFSHPPAPRPRPRPGSPGRGRVRFAAGCSSRWVTDVRSRCGRVPAIRKE